MKALLPVKGLDDRQAGSHVTALNAMQRRSADLNVAKIWPNYSVLLVMRGGDDNIKRSASVKHDDGHTAPTNWSGQLESEAAVKQS